MKNKMSTKSLILPILLGLSIFTTGCTNLNTNNSENTSGDIIGLANPASIYCEENGGTLEMIFDNGESYGMCHFQNGSTCEEREYYRKECFPVGEKTGNKQNMSGNTIKTMQKGEDTRNGNIDTSTGDKQEKNKKDETKGGIDAGDTKQDGSDMTVCTMDAKQCPDGSYVGRAGPNCEFEKCKTQTDGTQNDKSIDEIIDEHQDSSGYQEEGLTEDDIDLMEQIIDKLK